MKLLESLNRRAFEYVHLNNLVYNTCWEDPRLDREALSLGPNDSIAMITSAGCNALDYALCEPATIHAVDMNPRQNALLELKRAAIRKLDYETFFSMFGQGRLPNYLAVYQDTLRPALPTWAQKYTDKQIRFFSGRGWRRSFFFHGTSGTFARMISTYIDKVARIRKQVEACLNSQTLDEQRERFERDIKPALWGPTLRWFLGRNSTLALLGVPTPQRRQVEHGVDGGVAKFIENSLQAVFMTLPLKDNYFWRVYVTGKYTPECCPEYLKPDNFLRLKGGLVDRIHTHTDTMQGFLEKHPTPISRFVLLDHMDWLADTLWEALCGEWQAIVDRAAPQTRLIWRSGGLSTDFIDRVPVQVNGQQRYVGDLLRLNRELADRLHPLDRVHTYGSFYIADLTLNG